MTFFTGLPSSGPLLFAKDDAFRDLERDPSLTTDYVFLMINQLRDRATLHNFRLNTRDTPSTATSSTMPRPTSVVGPRPTTSNTTKPHPPPSSTLPRRDNSSRVTPRSNLASMPTVDDPDDLDVGIQELVIDDSGGDDDSVTVANVILPASINGDFSTLFYPACVMSAQDSSDTTVAHDDEKFSGVFEALLDSGTTHHIFSCRDYFSLLDSNFTLSVVTANNSLLPVLGRGDVTLLLSLPSGPVRLVLRGCLYAPDVPINLISVGCLARKGVSCRFEADGSASLVLAAPGSTLPLVCPTVLRGNLSYLICQYVNSFRSIASDDPSLALFLSLPLTPDLWHQQFGHLGHDATRAALTRNYVLGVKYDGSFDRSICPSCVIGKGAQQHHPYKGNRADSIGGLLHVDLCGPWPVRTPSKALYAFSILDDFSNFGFTTLLAHKSDAFDAFRLAEAFLLKQCSASVCSVRTDGAKEFVEGSFGKYLRTSGVRVQLTAPYAHHQNSKAERFIRTLEDGCQTLLASSGLPDQFWGDAMLTSQYLRNRLPTSTLPSDITPHERIHGSKPDLGHLCVWGCLCFPIIPPKKHAKAGPRRFEAIFVGYEEGRVGYRVCSTSGSYSFSADVIFDELQPGRLGVPRSLVLPSPTLDGGTSAPRRRLRTAKGQAFSDEITRRADA